MGVPLRDRVAGAISTKPKDPSRPRRYWTARGVLGTLADVLGVVSPIIATVALLIDRDFETAVLAVTLAAIALTYIFFTFRLQRRFAHESRRAQAGRVLAKCHAHLRNAVMAIHKGDEGQCGADIFKASQTLAKSFSMATRNPCRVTVKDMGIIHIPEDAHVKTLCRSEDNDDKREASLPEFVIVKKNTDFLDLVRGEEVFFSNDLAMEKDYENEHFTKQMRPHEYPYRSTIVWPIKGPDPADGTAKVIGFLCVDSEDPGTFLAQLDVPTGRAVANAMYASLSLFRQRREARPVTASATVLGGHAEITPEQPDEPTHD